MARMALETNESYVKDLILRGIMDSVSEIIEDEIDKVRDKAASRLRGSIGSISARVLQQFDMRRMGNEIVVSVKIEDKRCTRSQE